MPRISHGSPWPRPSGTLLLRTISTTTERFSSTLSFQVLPIPVFDPVSDKTVKRGGGAHIQRPLRMMQIMIRCSTAPPICPPERDSPTRRFYWKPTYTQSGNYSVILYGRRPPRRGLKYPRLRSESMRSTILPSFKGLRIRRSSSDNRRKSRSQFPIPTRGNRLRSRTSISQPVRTSFDSRGLDEILPVEAHQRGYRRLSSKNSSPMTVFVADTLVMTISVIQPPGPILQLLAPSFAHVGDTVKLRGFAFGTGTGTVLFSGTPAPADIFRRYVRDYARSGQCSKRGCAIDFAG